MEFEPMGFSPKWLGPFWEDDVFGAQIKTTETHNCTFPKQFEEFSFYFPNLAISHVLQNRQHIGMCVSGIGVKGQKASRNTSSRALMERSVKG
jgi:hypothetical protein